MTTTSQEKQLPAPAPATSAIAVTKAPIRGGLQLTTYSEILKVANLMTHSGIIKDAKDESIAALKIMAGIEMGLAPFEAVNGLYIGPGGKVEAFADLLKNRIEISGRWSYKIVEYETEYKKEKVTVDFYENGKLIEFAGKPARISYDRARAEQAKLSTGRNSGTWDAWFVRMAFKQCIRDGATMFMPGLLNLHSVASAMEGEPEEVIIQTIAENRLRSDEAEEARTTIEAVSVDTETGEVLETKEVVKEPTVTQRLEATAEVAREVGREDIAEKKEELAKATQQQKSQMFAAALKLGYPLKDVNSVLKEKFGTTVINVDQLKEVNSWFEANRRK